ncbi:hypothetical protein PRZ48_002442 [Zasmidium cellare]|uniref:Uncharacterized protein n=1 Tax=Zasmidium cellare TaxID=395010 RepID=A0ABR0F750_ZASCE|nr:hypothetical protein PRZ48_002442 [Zasmidium cellare]
MPPKTPLSSALSWKCPQCTIRSFATSSKLLAVGPEHPRYIEVPEPPQQTVPHNPPVKGTLPIPRNVFAGTSKGRTDDEVIALSTRSPKTPRDHPKGSREEWKAKMSEIRKQNLREGVKSLRARQVYEERRMTARQAAKQAERQELLERPEREDERLTAPSINMDLDALYNKPIPDPTRDERIRRKQLNIQRHEDAKRQERMDAVHSLYMNAREFIVTPQQLDRAVDAAFGTPEVPAKFGTHVHGPANRSIWAEGRPERVQDKLNLANGQGTGYAMRNANPSAQVNKERIRRIAETFTGGKMEKSTEDLDSLGLAIHHDGGDSVGLVNFGDHSDVNDTRDIVDTDATTFTSDHDVNDTHNTDDMDTTSLASDHSDVNDISDIGEMVTTSSNVRDESVNEAEPDYVKDTPDDHNDVNDTPEDHHDVNDTSDIDDGVSTTFISDTDDEGVVKAKPAHVGAKAALKKEILSLIKPHRDSTKCPPFSTAEMVVMAIICGNEASYNIRNLRREILATYRYYRTQALNDLLEYWEYEGGFRPDELVPELQYIFHQHEAPLVRYEPPSERDVVWLEDAEFTVTPPAARTFLESWLYSGRQGAFPFFRLAPELRNSI